MSKFNANSAEIEDLVQEIAKKSRVRAFYPQTISRKLNIPLDIVWIELINMSGKGRINLKYEVKCLDDLNILDTIDDYRDKIGEELFCEICGNQISITYNNIYPIFYFDDEYKAYLKKKGNQEEI